MAHDLENPRTKKYSKFKSLLISLELILKKGWLFIFVIINCFFHTKKKNYIDIGNYKNKDSRFINFLFKSLKPKYNFSYNINLSSFSHNNFSYNISLSILDFVKKVGIKNFVLNSTPNFFVKKSNKIKFNLNSQKQDGLNFNTNYFNEYKEEKLYLPYYMYPKIYNSNYEDLEKFKLNLKPIKIFFSGSTNNEVYGKFTWFTEDKVKLLNRIEIIEFIIKNFNDKIFFLKSYKDLNKVDHSKTPIILSVNDGLIKKSKTNLSNTQHLELISKSNFILTAPGADMPLCHHLIEGIKMKTVPISNYANLHKPLISENDYIYFNDYESLHKSILTALNEKLSPTSFLNTFESRKDNEIISCNDIESLKWLQ